MLGQAQALAYAQADFEEPHSACVRLFQEKLGSAAVHGALWDVGCGPGDITLRLAETFPDLRVDGVDGSPAMLSLAQAALVRRPQLVDRVRFFEGIIPEVVPPESAYGFMFSNSLLHHLPDPTVLWVTIRRYGLPGCRVFVHDLRRPAAEDEAQALVDQYSVGEPEVLRNDFYNSLLAAFTPEEIQTQLAQVGLDGLAVEAQGDRHVAVYGRLA